MSVMGTGNRTCLPGRGAGALELSGPSLAGDWQPTATPSSPVLPREPSSPPRALGTMAVSPAVVKITATRTRESSGLYTVSSTLFARVTREDRNSLYQCTVHYWLRGQRHAVESRRVNVTIFCELGAGDMPAAQRCMTLRQPSLLPPPQTLQST